MEWLELTIDSASEGIGLLEAALTLNGFDSFVIDDEAEFHNFLETNRDYWDIVDEELEKSLNGVSRIRLYLEDRPEAMEDISRLRERQQRDRTDDPGAGKVFRLSSLGRRLQKLAGLKLSPEAK